MFDQDDLNSMPSPSPEGGGLFIIIIAAMIFLLFFGGELRLN